MNERFDLWLARRKRVGGESKVCENGEMFVCVRTCASGQSRSCQETLLPSSLLVSSSPSPKGRALSSSSPRQTGRRSAPSWSPAAPEGSCCQQATWIVWTLRAKLWHAEVTGNHSTKNWPTAQLMLLPWFRAPNEISLLQYSSYLAACCLSYWAVHLERGGEKTGYINCILLCSASKLLEFFFFLS